MPTMTGAPRRRARPRLETQSRIILTAISKAGGRPLNTTEINQYLVRQGILLPTSSLYRVLKTLSEEGQLLAEWRSEKTGHASAAYRLAAQVAGQQVRIACRQCGKTLFVRPDSDLALALARACEREGIAIAEGATEVLVGCRGCERGA